MTTKEQIIEKLTTDNKYSKYTTGQILDAIEVFILEKDLFDALSKKDFLQKRERDDLLSTGYYVTINGKKFFEDTFKNDRKSVLESYLSYFTTANLKKILEKI